MNGNQIGLGKEGGAQTPSAVSHAASVQEKQSRAATLSDFMDDMPVGSLHRFVVWVIGIGLFFDMYEIFLVSSIGTALQNEYGLSRLSSDFKLLLASAFIGMFFGSFFLGSLADRIGRRKAFTLYLIWYSAFSLLGAFSVNAGMLVICRFLTGLGVGALYPVADTFLSEILPKERRGRRVGLYHLIRCGSVGWILRRMVKPIAFRTDSGMAHYSRDWESRRRVRHVRSASYPGKSALVDGTRACAGSARPVAALR